MTNKNVNKNFDDLSYLSAEERKELEEAVNEDIDKDTITEEEFNQYIQKWRDKLSVENSLNKPA